MIRYEIQLLESYIGYQEATVIIEAHNEEEAREKAREMYDNGEDANGNALDWCDYDSSNYRFDDIEIIGETPIKRQYIHTRINR
jgi:hypothetical protein